MIPAARLQAAIELLEEIEAAAPKPADRAAAAWFKLRRYVGSKDRRAISELVWGCLRAKARLGWWLERLDLPSTARARVLAFLVLGQGEAPEQVLHLCPAKPLRPARRNSGRAPDRAAQGAADHAERPPAVAQRCQMVIGAPHRKLGEAVEAELKALGEAAQVDLRVNL